MDFDKFATLAYRNVEMLEKVETCSCYFCMSVFSTEEIEDFVDNEQTALCPKCDMDTVVPGHIDDITLSQVFEYWFTEVADEV